MLATVGCRRSDANTDSPRAAAKAFVGAMVSADAKTIADVSTGDEPSLRLLAAQAGQNAAYERVSAAAGAKGWDPAVVLGGRRAADHYATRLAGMDAEPQAVQGDAATVGEGRNAIHLVRAGGAWKVDRGRLVPPTSDDAAVEVAGRLALVDGIRKAHEEVAAGIGAGRYAEASDARAALMKLTGDAVKASIAAEPGTRSATAPILR